MQVTRQAGKTVQQVQEYDLFLDVDFRGLKFDGTVTAHLDSTGDVSFDAVGLQVLGVKSGERNISFKQEGNIVSIQTGKFSGHLEIEYRGKVSENLTGFYKAPYGDGYVLTTHFEAGHARQLLPCLDHPLYKAVFKLTVRTDANLSVISNMPVESNKREGKRKTVTFEKTPKMSTYLLYVGVGKFVEDHDRHGKTELYTAYAARPSGAIKTEFSFEAAKKALDFYETYFGLPYTLPKLHQIAVPEFAYGAMENWGAITYREIRLHVDKDTSVMAKKEVAGVIAHEIAHMWFGDLVTMKWWDDLWLNESFATFMGHKAVDQAYPRWAVWQDFVRTQTSGAMARDGLRSTHPIEARVSDPEEIEELFDEISYGKGASILRMIEAYIGADKFQKGVREYVQEFRYSNATGRDLWNHLQQASGTDVSRVVERWISHSGYPVVAVSLAKGQLVLEQERFLLAGGIEKQTWPIPLTMIVDGETMRVLFDKEKMTVDLPDPTSLKLNNDQTGFYLVYYKGRELQELVWKSRLSALDKWGLVSDAMRFLLSGRIPFQEYLHLTARYDNEEEYLPVFEVSDHLDFLYQIAPEAIRDTSRRFHSSELKIFQAHNDENSSLLKGIIAARLVLVDDTYAREQGSKYRDLEKIEPDMRRSVVMGYARSSDDYEGLMDRFKKSTTDEERLRHLEGLASLKKPELVARSLEFSLSENVKRQDVRNMVLYATANPAAKNVTWQWFKDNIENLDKMYKGTAQLSILMRNYVSILGVGRAGEVERFFQEHPLNGADAAIERLKIYERLAKSISVA